MAPPPAKRLWSAPILWKAVAIRINPPLITTQQESNRLLQALTSSFRQQLDQPLESQTSSKATQEHVHEILESPLFSHSRWIGSDQAAWQTKMQDMQRCELRRPAQQFQQRVAAGTADLQAATACLLATQDSCTHRPAFKQLIKQSGAGSAVGHWVRATGCTQFFHDKAASRLLIQFLVAEGKSEAVLKLLRLADATTAQRLTRALLSAEHMFGRGLAGSFELFGSLDNSLASASADRLLSRYMKDVSARSSVSAELFGRLCAVLDMQLEQIGPTREMDDEYRRAEDCVLAQMTRQKLSVEEVLATLRRSGWDELVGRARALVETGMNAQSVWRALKVRLEESESLADLETYLQTYHTELRWIQERAEACVAEA